MKLKSLFDVMLCWMITTFPASAQNLMARQMNIYFGSPKKVTVSSSQGTVITEFDRNGRVTNARQGSMSISYDWEADGEAVTMSMFLGPNLQESGHVHVLENTLTNLKYQLGDNITVDIRFKSNGSIESSTMTGGPMDMTITYLYRDDSDNYPYAIKQEAKDQAMQLSLTVNETDSYGNAVKFTQELGSTKEVTTVDIEYY